VLRNVIGAIVLVLSIWAVVMVHVRFEEALTECQKSPLYKDKHEEYSVCFTAKTEDVTTTDWPTLQREAKKSCTEKHRNLHCVPSHTLELVLSHWDGVFFREVNVVRSCVYWVWGLIAWVLDPFNGMLAFFIAYPPLKMAVMMLVAAGVVRLCGGTTVSMAFLNVALGVFMQALQVYTGTVNLSGTHGATAIAVAAVGHAQAQLQPQPQAQQPPQTQQQPQTQPHAQQPPQTQQQPQPPGGCGQTQQQPQPQAQQTHPQTQHQQQAQPQAYPMPPAFNPQCLHPMLTSMISQLQVPAAAAAAAAVVPPAQVAMQPQPQTAQPVATQPPTQPQTVQQVVQMDAAGIAYLQNVRKRARLAASQVVKKQKTVR